jgi:signal transduction histidine kinase/HAMP domain-containing protein
MKWVLRWYRGSVANRVAALTFGLVLFIAGGIALLNIKLGVELIQENAAQLLVREAEIASDKLSDNLSGISQDLELFAANGLVVNALGDPTGRSAYLGPMIANDPLANRSGVRLGLFNFRGELIAQRGLSADQAQDRIDFLVGIMQTNQRQALLVERPEGVKLWLGYPVIYPISGTAEGVAFSEISLSALMLNELRQVDGRYWALRSGERVMQPIAPGPSEPIVVKEAALVLPAPLNDLGLSITLAEYRDLARESIESFLWLAFWLLICALALAFVGSHVVGRYLTAPLTALSGVAESISRQGLRAIEVKTDAQDEIGRLARGFSVMLSQLRKSQNSLETQVAERTERLAQILELSPDGFAEITPGQTVGFVNSAFERITELSAQQFSGKPVSDLAAAFSGLQDSEGLSQDQVISPLIDQANLADELRVLRLKAPSSKVIAFGVYGDPAQGRLIYLRDISREAELDRMKSDFLSTAAHELRTPLASIAGYSELLLRGKFDAQKQSELVGVIHRHAVSVTALINDLLAIVRAEARVGVDYHMQVQTITPLISRAIGDFRISDDVRDLVLRLDEHLPMALFDSEKIRQVINNLLSNAFKYSPKGSPIEVATVERKTQEREWVGFRVKDYGLGMSEEEQSHLFERFYRANPRGSVPGTGLGLSLVKQIVDQHHGKIEVDSASGKGTAVTVLLPVVQTAGA